MSDLISRSELIKHFEAIQQQENAVGLEFVAMIDEIKEQPTAYDVDKVVEELNNISFPSETRHCENGLPIDNVVLLDKAIKIVKQGGVCEWRLCDKKRMYMIQVAEIHIF